MAEAVGLAGHAACNFLQIAGDVGELDAEPANPIGKLVDQSFTGRPHVAALSCAAGPSPLLTAGRRCGSRPSGGP